MMIDEDDTESGIKIPTGLSSQLEMIFGRKHMRALFDFVTKLHTPTETKAVQPFESFGSFGSSPFGSRYIIIIIILINE